MGSIRQLEHLFEVLDLNVENGLVSTSVPSKTVYQQYFFQHVKEKLGVDAIYFLRLPGGAPRIPLIYFSTLESYDAEKIAELHRVSWNLGEAPLLFVVLPDQLLIYNNYKLPQIKDGRLDPQSGLLEKIQLIQSVEEARQQLRSYHRSQLESGEYWRQNQSRFDIKTRVDSTLMKNLKIMRQELLKNIESVSVVHSLLGRSIFIKYLEDRKDKYGNSVFPKDFFKKFMPEATSFIELLQDKQATYKLFEFLHNKFNGDLFPVNSEERSIVSSQDLDQLSGFLSGKIHLENSQFSLWPLYTFDAIPIQLISNIYELFFHLQKEEENNRAKDSIEKNKNGTYYTPYHLVELLMDEVLPWEGQYTPIKILDPSCGSGIFLVEAYRRQIGRWLFSNPSKQLSPEQLIVLLKDNIYGVDCNEESIRVAAFSLCLTLCDYLEPKSIWENLRFPALRKENLFGTDFFDIDNQFNQIKYDVIIGNPPWESKLSLDASIYIENTKHPIGDKQIAQAFTWRAAELCKKNGDICLLLPSKGFLFNRSSTNQLYRQSFFNTFNVSSIINFSPFRKVLFDNASGPAVAIFYKPRKTTHKDPPILYCTPKPTYTVEDRRQFIIDPLDICRIPHDMVQDDLIWKIAMWGGPRDLDLIKKIMKNDTLIDVLTTNGLVVSEGYKSGNRSKHCFDFMGKPNIETKKMKRYVIPKEENQILYQEKFECTVIKNRLIFSAPHLIIKQSPVKGNGFFAAYLDYDAVFSHSFLGIHAPSDKKTLLKYICLLINSKVFTYYALMISRRWLVERDELEAGEIFQFPIPVQGFCEKFNERIEMLFDKVVENPELYQMDVESFATEVFHITVEEKYLIDDAIDITYDYFRKHNSSSAVYKPLEKELAQYEGMLSKILSVSFGHNAKFSVETLSGDAPLTIAKIIFGRNDHEREAQNEDVNNLLRKLDKLLLERRSQGVYVRRNVRIYEPDSIYIIKPSQRRFWSYSAACRDADEMFADIMRVWRKQQ